MPFLAAIVARLSDCSVLCTAVHPNHPSTDLKQLSEALQKVKGRKSSKVSVTQGELTIGLSTDDSLAFGVCAKQKDKKAVNLFLEELRKSFVAQYTEPPAQLSSVLCADYKRDLAALLQKLSTSAQGDAAIASIKTELDEVRDVMASNIDKVLDRNTKMESLVQQSDELTDVAQGFRQRARKVERKMWWEGMRMKLFLAAGLVFLILIISMIACGGPTYPSC